MNARLSRLAVLFSMLLAPPAAAETIAETVGQWGLIGPWSLDCALPPDHGKGSLLTYEVEGDGVINRRDFGDASDEGKVLSADVSADGTLNLRVYFPAMKQTRDYGLLLQQDGTLRAIYNRNDKGQYTIRNGRFTANGKPVPAQHKCEPAS
jgi:hypothetical protein